MARYEDRQFAPQASAARSVGFFSLVLFVLSTLVHRSGAIGTPEYLWVLAIVGSLAVLSLLLAILALRRVWVEDDAGAGVAVTGLLVASIVLAPFAFALHAAMTNPWLSDVATDTANPPALAAAIAGRDDTMARIAPIGPEQAALIRSAYPELVGRIYDLPPGDLVQAVLHVAEERGFELTGREEGDATATTLEFLGYSTLARFPADISIRLRQEGQGTRVDMRSASRYGRHDLGDNARRISGFLDALDYEVGVMQGVIVEEE
jgi:hypothetical protein